MTELLQKIEKFFKQKSTLSFMKEETLKATKHYITQNTIQFKNSGKAATLSKHFLETDPYISQMEKILEDSTKLL
jgi:hypothetical protein